MKKNKKETDVTSSIISFETFRQIGNYEQSNLIQKEPSAFNGWIRVRKYKVTVEPIEEPNEVITERLQKLWDECDNSHHRQPLKAVAKQLGYELQGDSGSKRKK